MIEHLESRIAPASIVITTSGTGLKVHGATPSDSLGLIINASSVGGVDVIDPNFNDVLTVNGGTITNPGSGGYLLHFPGATGDISITGGATSPGNNLQFGNITPGTGIIGGKLTLNLPAGNNIVQMGVANIGGAFLATTGPGNDQIAFTDNAHIGGVTKLSMGNGTNTVGTAGTSGSLGTLSFGGSFSYIGGTGNDTLGLTPSSTGNGQTGLSVIGNLNYLPGDGQSLLTLGSTLVNIGGSLTIKEGNNATGNTSQVGFSASSSVSGFSAFDVGGNLTWSTGTGGHTLFASLSSLDIGGKFSLSQGGNGSVTIQSGISQIGSIKGVVLPAKAGPPATPAGSGQFTFQGAALRVANGVSFSGFDSVSLGVTGSIAGSVTVSGENTFVFGMSNTAIPLEIGGSLKISPLATGSNATFTLLQNMRVYGSLTFNGAGRSDNVILDSDQVFGSTKINLGVGQDAVQFAQSNNLIASLYAGATTIDFGADPAAIPDTFSAASGSSLGIQFLGAVKVLHDDTGDAINIGTGVHFAVPIKATP